MGQDTQFGAGGTTIGESPQVNAAAEHSGTPPGDRAFRPDIQGLRALAVALVVLNHARVQIFSGGYVGVDVFFVISGYVITGLLLRERSKTGKTSLLRFYARRARRILPASTIVIVGTLVAGFHYLGFLSGGEIASDAQAAALFVANFHFIALGTNYATAQSPPSPLQHFWSLAVEEQFYFVYPALFLLASSLRKTVPLRVKLTVGLILAAAASYAWSIHLTMTDGPAAYFSPVTRAWELALGALVAVLEPHARHFPARLAAVITWAGLAGIIVAALTFNSTTAFPGWIAMLPVVSTALVIFLGTNTPRFGAEILLQQAPLQGLGAISYSLYLLHWQILTIYAEHAGKPPSIGTNLILVAIAIVLSTLCYLLIENPIRKSKWLGARPLISVLLIPICIGTSLLTVFTERQLNHLSMDRYRQLQQYSVVLRNANLDKGR